MAYREMHGKWPVATCYFVLCEAVASDLKDSMYFCVQINL